VKPNMGISKEACMSKIIIVVSGLTDGSAFLTSIVRLGNLAMTS